MRTKRHVAEFLDDTKRDAELIATRTLRIAEAQGSRRTAEAEPASAELSALVGELRQRNDELTLCVEELRAQRDALAEGRIFIERERAKFYDLFEHAPEAFLTSDPRGVIVDANKATGELLGMAPTVLPGKLLIGFVARSETRAFRTRLLALSRHTGGLSSFETLVRPRGGSPFNAAMHVRPVCTGNGQVFAHRWTIHDVSKRQSGLTREMRDLLGVAVEELQAPLATLAGWSRLLVKDRLDDGEVRFALDENAESARAAGAILNELGELVALARDEEAPSVASMGDLLSLALDRVREPAAQRGVRLDLAQPVPGSAVLARSKHVTWALGRLLALAVAAASGDRAVTALVSADARDAIVQVRATGAVALGGSALTVAVARAAIERQPGRLWVPPLAEHGVVFEVRLPLAGTASTAALDA